LIEITKPLPGSKTPIHGDCALAKFPEELENASCQITVFFDLEKTLPCVGLVIDRENALLLKPKIEGTGKSRINKWQRIGVAKGLGQYGKSPIDWDSQIVKDLTSRVVIE
jgi:hypothetical protein